MTAFFGNCKLVRPMLAMALAAVTQSASGASGFILPNGLYRVDSDATTSDPDNSYSNRAIADGRTGDAMITYRSRDMVLPPRMEKGHGPNLRCISVRVQSHVPVMGSLQCPQQNTRKVGDALVHTASCPNAKSKMTIRRLDDTRWEYITEIDVGSETVPPNLMFLKPALRLAAREAKTEAERAAAQKQLTELDSMQKEMVIKRRETADMLDASMRASTDPEHREALRKAIVGVTGTIPATYRIREIWTRIADNCSNAPAG